MSEEVLVLASASDRFAPNALTTAGNVASGRLIAAGTRLLTGVKKTQWAEATALDASTSDENIATALSRADRLAVKSEPGRREEGRIAKLQGTWQGAERPNKPDSHLYQAAMHTLDEIGTKVLVAAMDDREFAGVALLGLAGRAPRVEIIVATALAVTLREIAVKAQSTGAA